MRLRRHLGSTTRRYQFLSRSSQTQTALRRADSPDHSAANWPSIAINSVLLSDLVGTIIAFLYLIMFELLTDDLTRTVQEA